MASAQFKITLFLYENAFALDSKQLKNKFGNRIRNRACALVVDADQLLLLTHQVNGERPLIIPPGGEVNFGENLSNAALRELEEETHLKGKKAIPLFTHEFLSSDFHAIEHFFLIKSVNGQLKLGSDPELSKGQQIIRKAQFMAYEDFKSNEKVVLHDILRLTQSIPELLALRGYFFNGKRL